MLPKLLGAFGAGDESPVIRHFLKVFTVDALARAAGVLLLPLYLVLMTQEAYATFNYLTSVIAVLAQVCTFGLYVPQSKLFHDVHERERSTLFLTIGILLFVLLALTLLPTYLFGWDRNLIRFLFSGTIDYERYRYLIPAGMILAVCSQMTLNYFLTREQIGHVQRFNVLRLVLGGACTIGALHWIVGDGAKVRLSAALVAEFTALAALSLHYVREMHGSFSPVFARRALAMGLPIMGSAALGIAINFGDKFFIEKYCSLADMSVYFLGLTFASVISVVFLAFNNVWLPGFLREKDLQKNLARTKRTFRNLLLVFSALSVLIWLAVAGALQFGLINHNYIRVLNVLPVLLVATICSSLVGLLSVYTVYWEMTYVTIITGTIIAVISVPLNYIGARDYGILGIGCVSIVINVLYGGIYYGFIRHRVGVLSTVATEKALWRN